MATNTVSLNTDKDSGMSSRKAAPSNVPEAKLTSNHKTLLNTSSFTVTKKIPTKETRLTTAVESRIKASSNISQVTFHRQYSQVVNKLSIRKERALQPVQRVARVLQAFDGSHMYMLGGIAVNSI
jgi:hypothetical protein